MSIKSDVNLPTCFLKHMKSTFYLDVTHNKIFLKIYELIGNLYKKIYPVLYFLSCLVIGNYLSQFDEEDGKMLKQHYWDSDG